MTRSPTEIDAEIQKVTSRLATATAALEAATQRVVWAFGRSVSGDDARTRGYAQDMSEARLNVHRLENRISELHALAKGTRP